MYRNLTTEPSRLAEHRNHPVGEVVVVAFVVGEEGTLEEEGLVTKEGTTMELGCSAKLQPMEEPEVMEAGPRGEQDTRLLVMLG